MVNNNTDCSDFKVKFLLSPPLKTYAVKICFISPLRVQTSNESAGTTVVLINKEKTIVFLIRYACKVFVGEYVYAFVSIYL